MRMFITQISNSFKFILCITLVIFLSNCTDNNDSEIPEPIVEVHNPLENPEDGPAAGNPDDNSPIPAQAGLEDVTNPDNVVGDGTPESCTCNAVVDAVAKGGKITFDCGPDPITITMDRPAKVFNTTGGIPPWQGGEIIPETIIDGGGLVTLSGGGTTRILYMNTCDENQGILHDHCQNQDSPKLTIQNLTFADGNSTGETQYDGGGAIWVRGGRFKAVNCRFFNNICIGTGPDVGGGAITAFSQYEGQPIYIVNCTFGGEEGYGNVGSNGGAISSILVSWTIINSVFTHNRAIGNGGNPADDNTPGGGSGGAIYNDGNTMTLDIRGSKFENNEVNAFGSAIFFVSNDHSGNIKIDNSTITNNIGGSWYPAYPQISMHDDTPIEVTNSIIE